MSEPYENPSTRILRLCLRCLAPLAAAFLASTPASAQQGGIEVFAANTLFAHGTRASVTHIYEKKGTLFRGSNDVSDPLDREKEEHRVVIGIDHGLRPDLTVSALVPYVFTDFQSDAGDSDGSGPGDVALLGKYRVYKLDWPQSSFNVSVVGGVETPTGDTTEREGGSRIAPTLQPGSGAWNPFGAVATNLSLGRYRLDALVFYKLNTEGAQNYERGDFLALELDAAYRFLHTKYPGPTASAKVGLQWRHEERAEQDGSNVPNTGSDELLVRTGLTWHPTPGIDIKLSVDLPVYQDYNGEQLGLDVRTFLAAGLRF